MTEFVCEDVCVLVVCVVLSAVGYSIFTVCDTTCAVSSIHVALWHVYTLYSDVYVLYSEVYMLYSGNCLHCLLCKQHV